MCQQCELNLTNRLITVAHHFYNHRKLSLVKWTLIFGEHSLNGVDFFKKHVTISVDCKLKFHLDEETKELSSTYYGLLFQHVDVISLSLVEIPITSLCITNFTSNYMHSKLCHHNKCCNRQKITKLCRLYIRSSFLSISSGPVQMTPTACTFIKFMIHSKRLSECLIRDSPQPTLSLSTNPHPNPLPHPIHVAQ